MQVKLLRMLQERTFEPVGSTETRTVDVRVVLATNVDLAKMVADRSFRQDLYYRVNVVNIRVPPLRERLGDITLLATHFLRRFTKDMGREILGFTEAAMGAMRRYGWPGNVRELENAVERAVVLCRRPQIDVEDLPETLQTDGARAIGVAGLAVWRRRRRDLRAGDAPSRGPGGPERRIIEQALSATPTTARQRPPSWISTARRSTRKCASIDWMWASRIDRILRDRVERIAPRVRCGRVTRRSRHTPCAVRPRSATLQLECRRTETGMCLLLKRPHSHRRLRRYTPSSAMHSRRGARVAGKAHSGLR